MSVHFKHCSESATTSQEGAGISTELPKNLQSKCKRQASQNVARAKKISLAKKRVKNWIKLARRIPPPPLLDLYLLLYVACITRILLAHNKIFVR
jgi:hypothetical protein